MRPSSSTRRSRRRTRPGGRPGTEGQILLALALLGTVTFALNGALTASGRVRLDVVGVLALGVVTAVGGGTIRDVLTREVPSVLTSDLYAIPAVVGATAAVLGGMAGVKPFLAAALRAALCFVIRVVGVRSRLQEPVDPPRRERRA